MILKALHFTDQVLGQYLRNKFNLDESKVILNDVIDENGNVPDLNKNKLVLSLINIERETLKPFNTRNQKLESGNYSMTPPINRYNLEMMVSSHFDDYSESIKFLNAAMLFFQINPTIDSSRYSSIPKGLTKLDFEMDNITYHQMFNLWNAMGAKYRPSVIYKIRLITLNPNETTGFDPAITRVSNTIE